ncbi:MAG: DUF58 domain-containing protein [Sulfuricella sp.]|nr:DUF58 domain-containing protein [Sulfuricella sp.]
MNLLDALPLRPTASGMIWLAAVLALLATAINYGNNIVFALAFLLLAVWLQSAWECRRNLSGLAWNWLPASPVFSGEAAQLGGMVENAGSRPRRALSLARRGQSGLAWDAPARGEARLEFPCRTAQRGKARFDGFSLSTRHPLGLWQARRRLPPPSVLVYPAPDGDAPLPAGSAQKAHRRQESSDFHGVRAYAPGDRLGRINWRAWGRREELLVNVFDGGSGGQTLWLDANLCHGGLERRLSQLAAWVVAAERGGQEYGLDLDGSRVPPGRGRAQRESCLALLALHEPLPQTSPNESPLREFHANPEKKP